LEDNDLWTEYNSIEGCKIVDEADWFMRLLALVKEAYEKRVTTFGANIVKGDPDEYHEAIDLGLSVKWASCNVGATMPKAYGCYYGWADPTGKKRSTDNDDYPSATPPSNISGTEYDLARAKWGGRWRLPTKVEFQELIDKCYLSWTKQKGVNGLKVTGPNRKSIFLPAASYRGGTGRSGVGSGGGYWSGTLDERDAQNAYKLSFDYRIHHMVCGGRSVGLSVRPVEVAISVAGTKASAEIVKGHEAIDLGLSVKWASCNVGAKMPGKNGGYYGWADPIGKNKSTVNDDYPSATPASDICGTEYDIARAKWGGRWRLPTEDECEELVDKCEWKWTKQNDVKGMKVTGPNGNSIFLPAAGNRYSTWLRHVGSSGYYWSGTLSKSSANSANLNFDIGGYGTNCFDRYYGFSVRPVVE
jgi:hypothetical protein